MAVREDSRSIGDLLGDLGQQVSTLVRREIDLARVEIRSGLQQMARGAAMSGIGGLLVYAGLLFVLAAIALGLMDAGVDPWLAALLVGIATLAVGGILAWLGVDAIRKANPAPTETAETVRENVEYLKEKIK
jgi:hypothetical protein